MKTLILVNTLTSINSAIYSNHIAFWGALKHDYPNDDFIFYTPERMTIDNARNQAAKMALNLECDYLMFIDDDVLLHTTAFSKLLEADMDIIAGLVIIRGYPFNIMAFKDIEETDDEGRITKGLTFYNDLPLDEEGKLISQVLKCGAVGFSCCLIKTKAFIQMNPPYFVTGTRNTEDVYFCEKYKVDCSNEDKEPSIGLHTGVRCGHLMLPEAVEWATREKFQAFYKPIFDASKIDAEGRNLAYLEKALQAL